VKKVIFLLLVIFFTGCGYGMKYTKTIAPFPQAISNLKIIDVKDVKIVTRDGEVGSGKAMFVKSMLMAELQKSQRFNMDEGARHQLLVSIDGYKAGYRKYIALSAQILDTSSNKILWSSAISGVSKKYIDEVIKNVVQELVKDMSKVNEYYRLIWRKIKDQWTVPEDVHKEMAGLETIIVLKINKDGKVQEMWYEKRSGNPQYDQTAWQAIKKAEPFSPFPKEFGDDTFEIAIRFRPN
jgi:TonB family protein